MKFEKFQSSGQLTVALAELLAAEFERASSAPHLVMLAGGRTPLAAYAELAAHRRRGTPALYLGLSDERHVPVSAPESNAGQLAALVCALQLPPERVLFPDTAPPLAEAARVWDAQLSGFLARGGTLPLGVLGLGADGHTASLFTLDDVARGHGRLAMPVTRPALPHRLSVTPGLLEQFARLVMVTAGAEKLPMVARLQTAPLTIPAGAATARAPRVECWYAP